MNREELIKLVTPTEEMYDAAYKEIRDIRDHMGVSGALYGHAAKAVDAALEVMVNTISPECNEFIRTDVDIDTLKVGDKIIYNNLQNGYESEKMHCQKHLTLNETYTVVNFEIGGWSTKIWLEGFEHPFNSVMFGPVPD